MSYVVSNYSVHLVPISRKSEILSALSELPAFLVKDGGLNSGFMLAHCTAAALGKDHQLTNRD